MIVIQRLVICMCFLWFVVPTWGQQAESDLLNAEQTAFRNAVEKVDDCVVQIETFGRAEKVDRQIVAEGPLTGVIVESDGWIVSTLYGFKQTPASILVSLPSGNRVPARVVARDYSRELVLLKVETDQPLPVAQPADPSQLQVGQWCLALGKTYDSRSVTQSVGIISALGRAYGRAVQTDAKVSPINYGGPLIDLRGKVIGVLTPIAAAEMLADDGTVLYDSGIGFAIPLAEIQKRLEKMKAGKDIRPGKLGVVTQFQNELAGPVKLSGAAPGTPAAKAGAKAGDVLIRAAGKPIELLADLREALAETDAEELLKFTVRRGAELLELECTLVADVPIYRRRFLGIQIETHDLGLKVTAVLDQSPAAVAGIKVGQLLTECNQQPLRKPVDLIALTAVAELESQLEIKVMAEGQPEATLKIQPTTWPAELIQHTPRKLSYQDADGKEDANARASLTTIKLNDLPNKIHALIPPQANRNQLGCIVLFPEPGAIDAEKFRTVWEEFSRSYGWIVVLPTSSNPKSWSRDEATEIPERLMARLGQEYQLDPTKCVIGGLGVGGQLAIRVALTGNRTFPAVLTLGSQLRVFSVPKPSMPMQTIDFLFIGSKADPVAEQLNSVGYVANSLDPDGLDITKWESLPMPSISQWLESLGYL